jgi:hypothetical protein
MSNRGKVYSKEEGIGGFTEIKWFDSRGKYIGFDIINDKGISIQDFNDEDGWNLI